MVSEAFSGRFTSGRFTSRGFHQSSDFYYYYCYHFVLLLLLLLLIGSYRSVGPLSIAQGGAQITRLIVYTPIETC